MKNLIKSYYKFRNFFWDAFLTEWNSIKSDKAVVSTFFSISIIILALYTYIYSNEVVKDVPIAIVNLDASKTSRDYISMLESTDGLHTISTFTNLQEAKEAYYKKKVRGIVIVPSNFEKNIRSGQQVVISTFSDASNMVFYKKVLGDITLINGYFNAGIVIKKYMSKGMSFNEAQQNYSPIKSVSKSLFNTSSGYATYIIPMLTALIVQLVLLMGIGILNGSRQETTTTHQKFPRLLSKGGTIPVLLAKSSLYSLLFAIVIPIQIGIIYTIFKIPVRSSLTTVYLFLIPYLFSVVFLGIAISSLFKKREDAILFLVLISIPSLMLSGLSFPVEGFSKFYQKLATLVPSTSGINGFVRLTQMKASFFEVINEWKHLWVLTILFFLLAAFSLKKRAKKEYLLLSKKQF